MQPQRTPRAIRCAARSPRRKSARCSEYASPSCSSRKPAARNQRLDPSNRSTEWTCCAIGIRDRRLGRPIRTTARSRAPAGSADSRQRSVGAIGSASRPPGPAAREPAAFPPWHTSTSPDTALLSGLATFRSSPKSRCAGARADLIERNTGFRSRTYGVTRIVSYFGTVYNSDVPLSSLSVFFPAYNDAPSLPALIGNAFRVLESSVEDFELIVVNDGSQDDTGAVLKRLCREYGPRLRVVTHPANRGYGGALRTGFGEARMEWVFYTDGDGQYDVGELPKLMEQVHAGVGLVNGYKLERSDPRHRIWIGRVYNWFARVLFRIRLRDIDCDYRLIRRDLLQDLKLSSTSGTICVELVRKLELSGCEVVEVGVHHYPRLHGRSQFFRVKSLLTTLEQIVCLHFKIVVVPFLAAAAARALRAGSGIPAARRH